MLARVITTSSHQTLYIPRGWDVFTYHGHVYRFHGDRVAIEYLTRSGRWRPSVELRLEAA